MTFFFTRRDRSIACLCIAVIIAGCERAPSEKAVAKLAISKASKLSKQASVEELRKLFDINTLLIFGIGQKLEKLDGEYDTAKAELHRVANSDDRNAIKQIAGEIVQLAQQRAEILRQGVTLFEAQLGLAKNLSASKALSPPLADLSDLGNRLEGVRSEHKRALEKYEELSANFGEIVAADASSRFRWSSPSDADIAESLQVVAGVQGSSISRADIDRNMPQIRESLGLSKSQ